MMSYMTMILHDDEKLVLSSINLLTTKMHFEMINL
jgi:hypothetical protein